MTQIIEFGGLDFSTVKTAAPQGSLLTADNVYRDAGGLRPLPRPEGLKIPIGFVPAGIHVTAGGRKMIIYRDAGEEGRTTLWYGYEEELDSTTPEFLCVMDDKHSIDVDVYGLKNFLILKDADRGERMLIYLLNPENDTYEGPMNMLPEFPVEFALVHDLRNHSFEEATYAFSVDFTQSRENSAGNARNQTQAFFGGLNKYLADARNEGCFTEPFFVRYALRMYDGSAVMASAPVLMTPISTLRYIVCRRSIEKQSGDMDKVTLTVPKGTSLNPCRLFYRPLFGREEIERYKSIITHIDIYVSGPIPTYNSDDDVNWGHRTSGERIIRHTAEKLLQSGYSGGIEIGECTEKELTTNYSFMRLGSPKIAKESELTAFESVGQYYLIDSIPIGKLPMKTDKFHPVDIREGDLNGLEQKPRLTDGYQEHHDIGGKCLLAYNSRMNIGNVTLGLYGGFPIRMQTAYDSRGGGGVRTRIAVRLVTEGGVCWVCSENSRTAGEEADTLLNTSAPLRFLYYPDTRAKQMLIMEYGDDGDPITLFDVDLKEHPALHGAYHFTPYGRSLRNDNTRAISSLNDEEKEALGIDTAGKAGRLAYGQRYITQANKIYTSDVYNPLLWRVEQINTVGSGEIRGLATAARALSSGQFGQFPMYAFCTDGIWAMSTTESGSWAAVQPISREVLVGPCAYCNLDSAVAFATERSVMLISGAEVSDIAGVLDDSTSVLRPQHSVGLAGLGHFSPAVGFRENLAGCRMMYDYGHMLLYVYFPELGEDATPAYVLSFATQGWTYTDDLGAESGRIVKTLNLYPESGCLTDNGILRFGKDGGMRTERDTRAFRVVTNPFAAGDIMGIKKIREAGLIGDIGRERVRMRLWGSRDMAHWRKIGDMKGWGLREMCGTGYRWYILEISGEMKEWESLTGTGINVVRGGGYHYGR